MDEDDRFKHLASDPKFKVLKKKERKVQIDERFKSMFTDKKFTTSADNLKRFYNLKEEKKIAKNTDDAEDEVDEDDDDDDEEKSSEESLSESSDESDDDEEPQDERVQFDWQSLDNDAETAELASNRLAIQNLDWDKINVYDLFTLIKSIRMPLNVRIYVSEFGKERLAKEEIEGPQELIEMPKEDEVEEEYRDLKEKMKNIKNVGPKSYKINEYEDADEQMDMRNEELRERVRRYQLNRMKYYYAIAEFDSVESAELVYKELDGLEYEGSSIELDLRFVPDDTEFDSADIKAECDHVPDLSSYKAPSFISSALQQTTVNLTWDQTDVKRQEKLHRAFTKEEMEKDDLEAYLGSATDSEEEEGIEEEYDCEEKEEGCDNKNKINAKTNKYKQLLQSLDDEDGKKKTVDVDVEWDQEDTETSDSDQESVLLENNTKTDLNLMMIDSKSKTDDFEFDVNDDRFKAVYEEPLYNIDPSHPNFKRTKFFDEIAEKKRKKRLRIDS